MVAPDFDRLRVVGAEAQALIAARKFTRDEYERLYREASAAVGEHTEFLEGITMLGLQFRYARVTTDA